MILLNTINLITTLDKSINKAKKYNIKINNELPVNINDSYEDKIINPMEYKNINCNFDEVNYIMKDNQKFDLQKFISRYSILFRKD